MATESVDVGHISHNNISSDHNGVGGGGGIMSKHETGSNASGSISRRKQQNSNGLLIARSNLDIGPGNNNNSKMHNGEFNAQIFFLYFLSDLPITRQNRTTNFDFVLFT